MNRINKITILLIVMICSLRSMAQVGLGTSSPNANAAIDVVSTSQGILFPRLTTTQRDAIVSPAKGLTIFNTTLNCIQTNIGTALAVNWKCLTGISPSTNGTAKVSAYTTSTISGTIFVGNAVSGVTQTITATVTRVGDYNISTTANGITFAASGTFSATGAQDIVLSATGTANAKGSNTYTLNTTPNCSFSRYATITGVYANAGGTFKDFATHNLGADIAVNSFTYALGNTDGSGGTLGYLYQWGRQTDGHELRNSSSQAGPVAAPVANKFITNSTSPNDWISTQSNTLWLDASKATNDPCPTGFKVPSQAQLGGLFQSTLGSDNPKYATQNTWTWTGNGFMIGSNLYLPAAGYRTYSNAVVYYSGSYGYYWSSSVNGTNAYNLYFGPTYIYTNGTNSSPQRANGMSVRCIAVDNPSTNGTAVVSAYASSASAGTMTGGVAVSGVTQTITATVTTVGTYGITATANGVTFAASGTFAGTGAQNIVLTATGTPTATGDNTFTLNTTPNVNFIRTINANPSSNGTAVVSAYTSSASAGSITERVAVAGVTQTITATVTTVGTYNISTTANGVTFTGTGIFAGTGAQNIVLTATGTPTVAGDNTFTLNTTPNCNFSRTTFNQTTYGTAVVSAYVSSASAGIMSRGVAVSGVTQTITATVTTVGTYNISTTANGVTFAGTGTFVGTGAQNIVLTATGTPITEGDSTFTLNTSPNCNFIRTSFNPSSNGTGVVSAYTCTTASAGTLIVNTAVSGVTQTITATVSTVGSYSISATANGVTFTASGTFAGTGAQDIVLSATGTPTARGSNTFTLNTTPNCNFSRYSTITTVYANVGGTIKDFATHNLGADISLDPYTYVVGNADGSGGTLGYLYQWGRQTDGHELRNSSAQSGPVSAPIANKFITNSTYPSDWLSTQSSTLWLDASKAANDPCPTGYKVPSQNQWSGLFINNSSTSAFAPSAATQNTWTWTGNGFMVGTALYLPAAGSRGATGVSYTGYYWSSTANGSASHSFSFKSTSITAANALNRATGMSIRCIAQ